MSQAHTKDSLYGFSPYSAAFDTEPPPFSDSDDGGDNSFDDFVSATNTGFGYSLENQPDKTPGTDTNDGEQIGKAPEERTFEGSWNSPDIFTNGTMTSETSRDKDIDNNTDWADFGSFESHEVRSDVNAQDEQLDTNSSGPEILSVQGGPNGHIEHTEGTTKNDKDKRSLEICGGKIGTSILLKEFPPQPVNKQTLDHNIDFISARSATNAATGEESVVQSNLSEDTLNENLNNDDFGSFKEATFLDSGLANQNSSDNFQFNSDHKNELENDSNMNSPGSDETVVTKIEVESRTFVSHQSNSNWNSSFSNEYYIQGEREIGKGDTVDNYCTREVRSTEKIMEPGYITSKSYFEEDSYIISDNKEAEDMPQGPTAEIKANASKSSQEIEGKVTIPHETGDRFSHVSEDDFDDWASFDDSKPEEINSFFDNPDNFKQDLTDSDRQLPKDNQILSAISNKNESDEGSLLENTIAVSKAVSANGLVTGEVSSTNLSEFDKDIDSCQADHVISSDHSKDEQFKDSVIDSEHKGQIENDVEDDNTLPRFQIEEDHSGSATVLHSQFIPNEDNLTEYHDDLRLANEEGNDSSKLSTYPVSNSADNFVTAEFSEFGADDENNDWASFTTFESVPVTTESVGKVEAPVIPTLSASSSKIKGPVELENNDKISTDILSVNNQNDNDDWASFSSCRQSDTVAAVVNEPSKFENDLESDSKTSASSDVYNESQPSDSDGNEWATFSSFDSMQESLKDITSTDMQDTLASSKVSLSDESEKGWPKIQSSQVELTENKKETPLELCFKNIVKERGSLMDRTRKKSQVLESIIHDKYLQGEQSIWVQLRKVADTESSFKVIYSSSIGLRWMLPSLGVAFENIASKKTHKKTPSLVTPQTLSPASSISSFDFSDTILEPVPALLNDVSTRSDTGRQTLLVQSQLRDDKGNPVTRAASFSSLKKDSGSETTSETNSLDLEFFSSGSAQIMPGSINQTKGEQQLSRFNLDLLEVKFDMLTETKSNESDTKSSISANEKMSEEDSLGAQPTNETQPAATPSLLKGSENYGQNTLSSSSEAFLTELENLDFVTSTVLMFPSTLLQDNG